MHRIGGLVLATLLLARWAAAAAGEELAVFVQLIEQADTPACEAGVLTEILVREGQLVREGDLLARIEDSEARYLRRRAELEARIAREQAEDDVVVRATEKGAAVARNDLERAERTVRKNPNAISESEVQHLRLTAEKSELEVERARRDHAIAQIQQALKENELEFAGRKLARHEVLAPIGGMVVEISRRRGEWVQPGDKVLRIVGMDRLRAEGYADARRAGAGWLNAAAQLHVETGEGVTRFPGKIVFVSPEIDPVNGQVAVWAEIDNRDLRLRPGLQAAMQVEPVGPVSREARSGN